MNTSTPSSRTWPDCSATSIATSPPSGCREPAAGSVSPPQGPDDRRTTMDGTDVTEVLSKPISQELLGSSIPARLAYTGVDGDPRVVPVGFWWNGEQLLVFTVPT